jgi:hypothetical protein
MVYDVPLDKSVIGNTLGVGPTEIYDESAG